MPKIFHFIQTYTALMLLCVVEWQFWCFSASDQHWGKTLRELDSGKEARTRHTWEESTANESNYSTVIWNCCISSSVIIICIFMVPFSQGTYFTSINYLFLWDWYGIYCTNVVGGLTVWYFLSDVLGVFLLKTFKI